MGFEINPLTGQLDKVKVPIKSGTADPTQAVDGDIESAFLSSEGRVYFRVNGVNYYLAGTPLVEPVVPLDIKRGQPMVLLMALTYADDIT